MKIAIYPGSFDPLTYGHLDVIERSLNIADKLIVGVLNNRSKSPLFSIEERVKMLKELTSKYPNVEIRAFDGLLVDFSREVHANLIVRGLRAITDFEYELQMSQTNYILAPDIETVFLNTRLQYAYLSSSIVKEVAAMGGDISNFVPEEVISGIYEKYNVRRKHHE